LPTRNADGEASTASLITQEVALVLLSLVLALMAWYLVRTQVEWTLDLHARVEYETPPDCQVFGEDQVTFPLKGKKGELEAVQVRLGDGRERVRLVIRPLDPEVPSRPIRLGVDEYRLPFPTRLLEDPTRPPMPRGEVVRVRKQTVAISKPRLPDPLPRDWPQGVAVEVELLTSTIEVLAPADAIDGPIVPDEIDLAPFRESANGLAAPVQVTLGFERWRTEGDERLRARRAAVALPEVRAALRFVLRQSKPLTGPVLPMIKPGYVITEILPASAGSFTNPRSEDGLGSTVLATYTGEVRATQDLLDRLEQRGDHWRWVLRVADADLPTEADATKRVTATLTLHAFDSLFAPFSEGYIVFPPLQVPVEVRKLR
jgi:hypothetical protein